MNFRTTADGITRTVSAASAQEAAQIAERDSEGAAQVIALRDWPFPALINADRVPPVVLVGEALL